MALRQKILNSDAFNFSKDKKLQMADVAKLVHEKHVLPNRRKYKAKESFDSFAAQQETPLLSVESRSTSRERNEANEKLLNYFVNLSTEGHPLFTQGFDAERVAEFANEGADLNSRDNRGQTVLHDVAFQWNPTIARFLCELGADVNAADNDGRTPLHVAAAADFPDMCLTLIALNANREAVDKNQQTPLFFAAKTDSGRSLKILLDRGCKFDGLRDASGRTPLHVAAELDRSVTAEILVDQGADAFVSDSSGQMAFVSMIEKMPQVARQSLRQLQKCQRISRRQKLNLFKLDPREIAEDASQDEIDRILSSPQTSAMKAITNSKNYDIVKSPVVQHFVKQQWINFGRIRAVSHLLLQFTTIVLWTVFAVAKEWTARFEYRMPDDIYRIVILILAILLNGYNIFDEIMEFVGDKSRHKAWQEWRLQHLRECTQRCRNNDEEWKYLQSEMESVQKSTVDYFNDLWNYLDWSTYLVLTVALIVHFVDVGYPGGEGNLILARWHVRLMAIAILMLWIRLLKYWKPFEFFGPFIVMLSVLFSDFVKFLLLYLEFFIPFCCVFYTLMGGTDNMKDSDIAASATLADYNAGNYTKVVVQNFDSVNSMIFSVFRITLVDDYDYDSMHSIDFVTSQVLLGAWFAISTILVLNLFIAQLSETFKAVYDNAKAAALMQKAITIQSYYDYMLQSQKVKYHRMLKAKCNPLILPYDDDEGAVGMEELQKSTLQIRDTVTEMKEKMHDYCTAQGTLDTDEETDRDREQEKKKSKRIMLAESLSVTKSRIEDARRRIGREIQEFQSLLKDFAIVVGSAGDKTARVRKRE